MTTLILGARQTQRDSGFCEVALFSGIGLLVSLVLVHLGIDLGTLG